MYHTNLKTMLLVTWCNRVTYMFAVLSPAVSHSVNISTVYSRNFKQRSQEVTFLNYVNHYSTDRKMATSFIILHGIQNKNFL